MKAGRPEFLNFNIQERSGDASSIRATAKTFRHLGGWGLAECADVVAQGGGDLAGEGEEAEETGADGLGRGAEGVIHAEGFASSVSDQVGARRCVGMVRPRRVGISHTSLTTRILLKPART